jgi:hypothetical protein
MAKKTTTLGIYSELVDAASTFNRLAVRMKSEEITKDKAIEDAGKKIDELKDAFGIDD